MNLKRTTIAAIIIGGLTVMAVRSGGEVAREGSTEAAKKSAGEVMTTGGVLKSAQVMWNFFFNKPTDTRPTGNIPIHKMTRDELLAAPDNTAFRIGHSTVLLKLQDNFWLTDPMFSERASPVQWAGPQRFHQPPITIEELPPIKAVIISHDHYDHLDRDSIMKLSAKTEHFLVPVGVGDIITGWGVPSAKVRQLNWWQSTQVDEVRVVATPCRHFSGRGLFGKNQTLQNSWTILAPGFRIFFSGDSGYFQGFKRIGEQYGPFDLTLLEAGAYNMNWAGVHMMPEETVQAHVDLKGKRMLPIHNGTFDLSMHAWREPFDKMLALARARNVEVALPVIGEPVSPSETAQDGPWWASVDEVRTATPAGIREGAKPLVGI
ncbi:MBL fold metallo-hydrolase [Geomonas propionica]|uniref:MBL fold metallo-hydrolase n=1 Tax=Geomonas propionica TaxID=2798582 RepID=A0ABS0YWK0_9BACT|nr:MBL fold metallo-hydrolase [Geomonas propionica]MBJ6802296.1 MBL fold metallo-hydrolase [Geomonas propionica]